MLLEDLNFEQIFQGQKGGFSRPIPVNLANFIVARNSLIALPFGRRTLFLDKKLIRDKNIILDKKTYRSDNSLTPEKDNLQQ